MAVTQTTRLSLYQWSAGADTFVRQHLQDSLASIEQMGAGFLQGTSRPTASSAYQGFLYFDTGSDSLSYCDGSAWFDISGGTSFGSPANLTATSANADGAASTSSRSDHVHGMPGVGSAVSIGTSNTSGSGDPLARANHVHAIGTGAINASTMFAAGVVNNAALATDAVGTTQIQSSSVTNSKISAVDAGKITTGTLSMDRIAALAVTDAKIAAVDATKITTGTVAAARLPASSTTVSGIVQLSTSTSSTSTTLAATASAVKAVQDALTAHNHDASYSGISHNHSGVYLASAGTAAAATKLATARTIDITGDITATAVAFDGTANISISAAVNNDSHTHDTRYYTESEIQARQDQVYGYDTGHGGRRIFIQAEAPAATGVGDIWIDT